MPLVALQAVAGHQADTFSIFTFIWIPETKGIPIEAMETLFSGPVRHAAWRQKKVYPPDGLPPLPERVAAARREDGEGEGYKEDDKYIEHA